MLHIYACLIVHPIYIAFYILQNCLCVVYEILLLRSILLIIIIWSHLKTEFTSFWLCTFWICGYVWLFHLIRVVGVVGVGGVAIYWSCLTLVGFLTPILLSFGLWIMEALMHLWCKPKESENLFLVWYIYYVFWLE